MAVLKAAPEARRKQINILLIGFVVGFIVIQWGMPAFLSFVDKKEPKEAFRILLVTLSVLSLSALSIPVYFYIYGRRILKADQFPPPGVKVFRDTEIIVGHAAHRKAYVLIISSIIMALALLFVGLYFPYILYRHIDDRKIRQKPSAPLKTWITGTAVLNVKEITSTKF